MPVYHRTECRALKTGWRVTKFENRSGNGRAQGFVAAAAGALLAAGLVVLPSSGRAQPAGQPLARPIAPSRSPLADQPGQTQLSERPVPVRLPTLGAVSQPAGAPEGAQSKPLFRLSRVSLDGVTALDSTRLAAIYQPFLGKDLTQADLEAIAAALTQEYRDAGYHLSRALIPPQDMAGGHLRIRVVEGVIDEVVIKGNDSAGFGLHGALAPLRAEQPSRLATLERRLLDLNEMPGVRVADTRLEEIGTASGRFRLIVTTRTWHGYVAASIDNNGTKAAGPWQASFGTALNSILIPGDSFSFNGTTVPGGARELGFGRASYEAPIGAYGLRAGVSAVHSEVRPGDERRQLRTVSRAETYEAHLSATPLLTRTQSLSLTGGFGISDIVEQDFFGPRFKDSIWLGSLSADYRLHATENSWSSLGVTLRQGYGLVDPLPDSRSGTSQVLASPYFTVLGFSATHLQKLTESWSLKLAAAGQYSARPLLNAQQFYLGNLAFGRGFESGAIASDRAIAASAELRFDQPLKLSFAESYQLFAFAEGGLGSSVLRPKNLVQGLASAGGGIRLSLSDEVQLGLTIAKPLVYKSPDRKENGVSVLFSLTTALRLCPERGEWRCQS